MIESSVDLPQPEGPSTVRNSCGGHGERHVLERRHGVIPRAPLLGDGAHLDVGGGHGPHPIPGRRSAARAACRAARRWEPPAGRPAGEGWYTPSAMPPRWRPILSEIVPYVVPPPLDALAAELGHPVLRLSANENPLGPSPLAVAAIRREAERIHLYPDGGAPALAEAVAETLGVSPGQLIFGNGGDEILTLLGARPPRPRRRGGRPGSLVRAVHDDGPARRRQGRDEPAPRLPDRPRRRPGAHRAAHQARVPVEPAQSDGDGRSTGPPGRDSAPAARATSWCSSTRRTSTSSRRPSAPRTGWRRSGTRPESLILLRTFSKIAGLAGLRVGYAIGGPDVDRLAGAHARALQRRPGGAGGRGGGRARPGASRGDASGGVGGAAGAGGGVRRVAG